MGKLVSSRLSVRSPLVLAIVVCGFNLIIACVAYKWFPNHRHYLVQEDSLVEDLSAISFLASCFLALLFLARQKGHKKLLLLVSALGLVGFLDELSFGERIFNLSMPRIGGVKIDAIHDFFFLAYKYRVYSYPLAAICGIVILVLARPRIKAIMQHPSKYLEPHYALFILFAALIVSASVIDLDIVSYKPLFVLEEVLEMNAGITLMFCASSLRKLRPESRNISKALRSGGNPRVV